MAKTGKGDPVWGSGSPFFSGEAAPRTIAAANREWTLIHANQSLSDTEPNFAGYYVGEISRILE